MGMIVLKQRANLILFKFVKIHAFQNYFLITAAYSTGIVYATCLGLTLSEHDSVLFFLVILSLQNIPFYKYTYDPCHSLLWTCEQRSSWIILCFTVIFFFQTLCTPAVLFVGLRKSHKWFIGVKQIDVPITFGTLQISSKHRNFFLSLHWKIS